MALPQFSPPRPGRLLFLQIASVYRVDVAAAKSLACRYLLTEDLQADQEVDGITVVNPFLRDPASVLLGNY